MGTLDASLQSPARGTDVGARGAGGAERASNTLDRARRSWELRADHRGRIRRAAPVAAPAPTSSGAHVAAYLQANHGRTIASLYIYSLAMGLFLCFAAGLWSWLRQSEPAPQPLSAIFAFGAIALAVLILATSATTSVMSYRPQQPAFAVSLTDTTFGLLALSRIPTAVCLGAYAALVLRYRCLPAWTGWLAVLGVVAHILIAASFVSHGSFLSLEGAVISGAATFLAWTSLPASSCCGPRIEVD